MDINFKIKINTTRKRANNRGCKARNVTTKMLESVNVTRNHSAYERAVFNLGWRVFVCNDLELNLGEAVLAYRDEYLIERGFSRLRGKNLGLTPLYLASTTRIKGLIRLLSIGLRVLCLVEFTVREELRKRSEKLSGIYKGNPKRATARPTTELMLKAFEGINLVIVEVDGLISYNVTSLNAVQSRILFLLGFFDDIYQRLGDVSGLQSLK